MSERKYTVSEIDELRRVCESRWLFGTSYVVDDVTSFGYRQTDKDAGVEQLVRTYMLAGITGAEIYEEDKRRATSRLPENRAEA